LRRTTTGRCSPPPAGPHTKSQPQQTGCFETLVEGSPALIFFGCFPRPFRDPPG
jgi:hypothetical protein